MYGSIWLAEGCFWHLLPSSGPYGPIFVSVFVFTVFVSLNTNISTDKEPLRGLNAHLKEEFDSKYVVED